MKGSHFFGLLQAGFPRLFVLYFAFADFKHLGKYFLSGLEVLHGVAVEPGGGGISKFGIFEKFGVGGGFSGGVGFSFAVEVFFGLFAVDL